MCPPYQNYETDFIDDLFTTPQFTKAKTGRPIAVSLRDITIEKTGFIYHNISILQYLLIESSINVFCSQTKSLLFTHGSLRNVSNIFVSVSPCAVIRSSRVDSLVRVPSKEIPLSLR